MKTRLLLAALLATSTLGLAACAEKGPMEKMGESMDQAADDVSDAAKQTADDVEDAMN